MAVVVQDRKIGGTRGNDGEDILEDVEMALALKCSNQSK